MKQVKEVKEGSFSFPGSSQAGDIDYCSFCIAWDLNIDLNPAPNTESVNDRGTKRNHNQEIAKLRGARKHEAPVVLQLKRKTVISPTTQTASLHAPLSLIRPTKQMESLSVVPPVEGQELLQGAVLVV